MRVAAQKDSDRSGGKRNDPVSYEWRLQEIKTCKYWSRDWAWLCWQQGFFFTCVADADANRKCVKRSLSWLTQMVKVQQECASTHHETHTNTLMLSWSPAAGFPLRSFTKPKLFTFREVTVWWHKSGMSSPGALGSCRRIVRKGKTYHSQRIELWH